MLPTSIKARSGALLPVRDSSDHGQFVEGCLNASRIGEISIMKTPSQYLLSTVGTRRRFLRAMSAPVGAALFGGCGGGQEADAAVSSSPDTESASQGSNGAGDSGGTSIGTTDNGPSPAVLPPPTGPVPSWVAKLPLWHWYEIPNTALKTVDPVVRPLGITGPRSKIDAWCGAALKRKGSVYLIGAAGGHGDYAGNEVNALALNVETPRWAELRSPTPNADIINQTQFFLDGRPSPAHTYYASQFIESLDRLMVVASPGVEGPFPAAPTEFPYTGSTRSFSFDMARGDWDRPDYVAHYPGGGNFIAALCCKHPWTDDVYYARGSGIGWYRWTRVSNTWVRLSESARSSWYAGSAIDPVRSRMLVVGGYNPLPPEVHDLTSARLPVTFSGLGQAALTLTGYPGVVYDETHDNYLVVHNTDEGIKIIRVAADRWFVDIPPVTGGAPRARRNGILNAVQYVPELRGIVIANSHDGNVWFMRTAA